LPFDHSDYWGTLAAASLLASSHSYAQPSDFVWEQIAADGRLPVWARCMWAWAQLIVQPTEQECPNRSKEAGGLGVIAICSYSGCLELFKCCTKDLQPEPGCPDDMDSEKL